MHILQEGDDNKEFRRLVVKCEDDEEGDVHPRCIHGPTVLFYYEDEPHMSYYACAAYRDNKFCPFNIAAKDLTTKHLRRQFDVSTTTYRHIRQKFLETPDGQKHYCLSCNKALTENDLEQHLEHEVKRNLPLRLLNDPTLFLPPMDNDKAQAQYFFDQKSLKFFENTFRDLKIR